MWWKNEKHEEVAHDAQGGLLWDADRRADHGGRCLADAAGDAGSVPKPCRVGDSAGRAGGAYGVRRCDRVVCGGI